MACHNCAATPTGKLVRRKKIHNVFALSRPAAVFNYAMISFAVVGVVNDKLRTVRARRSPGSAPSGTSRTSRASRMLPGVRHRHHVRARLRPSKRRVAPAGDLEVKHYRVVHFKTGDNASERPYR